jgi:hypothetical protein|tara:strand:+ start:121 stop:450 length:330 start_codon:yes stop_codon:yes gene_type:complete
MAIFIYGTVNNTGKNFFTHQDRRDFFLRGYTGHDGSNYIDTWVIGANEKGALWLAEKSGTEKTKTEAQALVRASDTLARAAWDDNDVDGESADEKVARLGAKPSFNTLP